MPEDTQTLTPGRISLVDALSSGADRVTTLGFENDDSSADLARQAEGAPAQDARASDAPALPDAAALDPEATRYDKIPRFQELRAKAEQAEAARAEAEAKIAELEGHTLTLTEQYQADQPLYDAAQKAGFRTVSEYLAAVQEYEQQQQAQNAAQAALQTRADQLQSQVDSGEISLEIAQRLLQLESFAQQQQQAQQAQQQQAQQMTLNLNRQALREVQQDLPSLTAHTDLLGVLEKTLASPSGGDTIRTVGREMKAFGAAREQAGYDRAMAEMSGKPSAPPPLSGGDVQYEAPGSPDPMKKWSLIDALRQGTR